MTPRADILALEVSLPLLEVVRRFLDSEHSRMPVYRESLDDPIGVVHIKDLMRQIAPVEDRAPLTDAAWGQPALHRLRRDLLYVPASMRAADLLLRMRVARLHMALVIDEFGGTDGLVTLEDLVEAVVGEISDEHDEAAEPQIVTRPGGLLEADARVPLDELEALLGHPLALPDPEEDIDTVAGPGGRAGRARAPARRGDPPSRRGGVRGGGGRSAAHPAAAHSPRQSQCGARGAAPHRRDAFARDRPGSRDAAA